jgi:hypothetical protein
MTPLSYEPFEKLMKATALSAETYTGNFLNFQYCHGPRLRIPTAEETCIKLNNKLYQFGNQKMKQISN